MKIDNKTRRGWQVGLALFALTVGSVSYAAALPEENRLPGDINTGYPAIGFDLVDVVYKPGKTKRKQVQDTVFFAEGHTDSGASLSLVAPGYMGGGGVFDGTNFSGSFIIDAFISPKGTFKGGSYGVWSTDSMFSSNGNPLVDYDCNKSGKNCSTGYLVYGGDLNSFGWSSSTVLGFTGTEGLLELGITNQSGWAWDLWGSGSNERIIMDIYEGLNLNGANSVTSWEGTAKGIAVVPVPAAVWLFGSGLLGLMGVMKKRKRA